MFSHANAVYSLCIESVSTKPDLYFLTIHQSGRQRERERDREVASPGCLSTPTISLAATLKREPEPADDEKVCF